MKSIFATIFVASILAGCATHSSLLGWADEGPLVLSDTELAQVRASAPMFGRAVGSVSYQVDKICMDCGDYADNNNLGFDHVNKRIHAGEVRDMIREVVGKSGLFAAGDSNTLPVQLRVSLAGIERVSSVGAAYERKHPMSSGATLTTTLHMRYELIDAGTIVGTWKLTSRASSNSIAAATRIAESFDMASKRNVRTFLLNLMVEGGGTDAPRARMAMQALSTEVDSTRTAFGYLLYGTTRTASATGEALSEGVRLAAASSDQIAANMNATASTMNAMNRATSNAMLQAQLERRNTQVATSSHRSEEQQIAATTTAPAEAARTSGTSRTQAARGKPDSERKLAQVEADRQTKLESERAEKEKARVAEKAEAERQAKLEADRAAAVRLKAEEERKAKLAAEKAAEEKSKRDYLAQMRARIKLLARTCPDGGEHKLYVVGSRPSVKAAPVSCIDVEYEAICEGSITGSTGVAKNFLGAGTDCFFGDTATIAPTPACPAKQVRVTVRNVRECSG